MKVSILHITPLTVAVVATRTCYDSNHNSDSKSKDTIGEKDLALLKKVCLVNKHESVIEHISVTYDILGISRALLQELARHRIASYSVQSTRFTLKKHLKNTKPFIHHTEVKNTIPLTVSGNMVWADFNRASEYLVFTDDVIFNYQLIQNLEYIRQVVDTNSVPNDILKYALQECFKTDVVMTINIRSLRNMLQLRLSKHALKEFQQLAVSMYNTLPTEYKELFEDIIKNATTTKSSS